MGNQIVAKEKPVPMCETRLDHMDVVGARAVGSALDEPCVEWQAISDGDRRTPEVIVPLRLQYRDDPSLRSLEVSHLHEHIHDGLGVEAGNCRAAKVLDAAQELAGQASAEMVTTRGRPSRAWLA